MGRVSGPMKFRLILQPLMATFFAVKAGLRDARDGKPAYFWALFTEPGLRGALIGWPRPGSSSSHHSLLNPVCVVL